MVFDRDKNGTVTTPLLAGIHAATSKNRRTPGDGIRFGRRGTINDVQPTNVSNKRLTWNDLLPQILATVVAFALFVQPGINMVYSNVFLSHYAHTDVSELSWLTDIVVICTPIGWIGIGLIMDRIGRRNAILLAYVPLLMSWSIASVAKRENMGLIYASRFFAGIGGGMTSAAVVYVSEIAHYSSRQTLLSLNGVFFSAGILLGTTVGCLSRRWRIVNVVFFAFTAFASILSAVSLPESPVWLTESRADRACEAKRSLKRIYPDNDRVFAEEWDRLRYARPSPPSVARPDDDDRPSRRRFWNWWSAQPATVTGPIRVLFVVFLLQQLSGCYTVIFYAGPVVRSTMAAGTNRTTDTVLITLAVVRLTGSAVACALSSRLGPRPLLIGSSVAMACSAVFVALSLATADHQRCPVSVWPLVGVAAFVCSGSVGVLTFPWTLVGQLLPATVRPVAGAALVTYAYALMYAAHKTFPYVVASDFPDRSVAVVFAAFAVVSTAMAAYAGARLPETSRSDDVQKCFAGRDRLTTFDALRRFTTAATAVPSTATSPSGDGIVRA